MIIIRILLQTVVLALSQLWANKIRAVLTMLGIMIGVGAVIATVSATDGLKKFVLKEFDSFGPRKVWFDGRVPQKLRGRVGWREFDLKPSEIDYLRTHATTVDAITPMYFVNSTIRAGDIVVQGISATGITSDWHEIEKRLVTKGRPFIQTDIDEIRNVCLINDRAIAELELDTDPIEDFILINNRRFMIVGVVETKNVATGFPGSEARSEVYLPISTALSVQPSLNYSFALAQLKSTDLAEEGKAEISAILRRLRNIQGDDENTFVVETVQSAIDQITRVATGITLGAGGLVGISLLVGGIGIMNIMLVSVSERTREIGLRKAVGARPGIILMQFLTEAVVLCLVGGLIGIAAGFGLLAVAKLALESIFGQATVPVWAIALAVGFSAATGIIFGMFPAIKAARLDPIVALRHE
jgi:putative ABC transport system permease protein